MAAIEELYPNLIKGIIPHVSSAINWTAEERLAISNIMAVKSKLTKEDILNVENLITNAEKKINAAVNKTYPSVEERTIIFSGCWECEPLKRLLRLMGYKIMACGNKFDIWI